MIHQSLVQCGYFNPRSSCEERQQDHDFFQDAAISIHAPHARSDCEQLFIARIADISIHAPHARSDIHAFRNVACRGWISIHAPHARSDITLRHTPDRERHFNPRSSCEERPLFRWLHLIDFLFQSTLLMRGATHS